MSGGIFEYGAVTGIFSHAFNWALHEGQQQAIADAEVGELPNSDLQQCAIECAADQFGIQTAAGGALTAAGSPLLSKPFQMPGASSGTSLASKYLSKAFPQKLDYQIPTPRLGHLRAGTPVVGRAIGRFVPVIGQGLLVYDAVSIGMCTYSCATQ